jgi:thiol:disulfide interchange protein DsbC
MRKVLFLIFFLSACSQADEDLRQQLETGLKKTVNDVEVTAVRELPAEGLVEVELNGSDRVYATRDGRFLFTGEMLQITETGVENITQQRMGGVRAEMLSKVDPDDMITFFAEDEKAEIYAFTDVSCGYCRRLHQHMDELNGMGITVHYLAFPRGGMKRGAGPMMQDVWCADDRHSALTEAKLSGSLSVDPDACESPVKAQYELGTRMGVRGTPAIFTASGEQLGGYLPPEKLATALGLEGAAEAD